jgi:uncharacterized membrane protein YedE/YeeE
MSFIVPIVGSLMMGSSVYYLLSHHGNILGISGIFHSSVRFIWSLFIGKIVNPEERKSMYWKIAFLGGILTTSIILRLYRTKLELGLGVTLLDLPVKTSVLSMAAAGMLVGMGTRLAGGCTSGHMLCGLSRLSLRSFTATFTFFLTALLVSQLFHTAPSTMTLPAAASPTPTTLGILTALQLPFFCYLIVPLVARAVGISPLTPAYDIGIKPVSTFLISCHFSLGLILTGMVRPSKVLGFMNLPLPIPPFTTHGGSWDPTLLWVVVGGILTNLIAWQGWVQKMPRPTQGSKFELPTRRDLDRKLILGAAMFGIGWGWTGICPGPGLVGSFTGLEFPLWVWLGGVAVGGLLIS